MQPEAHREVRQAHDLCLVGAGDALQGVEDIQVGVVTDVLFVVAAVRGIDADQHEDTGRALLHLDAGAAHRVRQFRQGQADTVVDLHLGGVRVGIDVEVHREGHLAGRRTGRLHVEHVVDAVDLGLDGGSHRVGHGLGIRARIAGADRDLHRGNRRVLVDGQADHGHQACDDHDNGQHRRQDRALDEGCGNHVILVVAAGCVRGRLRFGLGDLYRYAGTQLQGAIHDHGVPGL